jgi:hypothetical protein
MENQHSALARCAVTVAALAALSACGGSPAPSGDVTVTVTPTVTATSGSTPAKAAAPAAPKSDVTGRGYDFGTITAVRTVAGVEVVILDRWTYTGIDDAKLASSGVPLAPFKGAPFANQNAKLTYAIPVAESARILYHHCVAVDAPEQTRSASMRDLAGLAAPENLVLVKLDEQGRAVAADNLPACP